MFVWRDELYYEGFKFLRAAMLDRTNFIDSIGIAYNNRSKTHDYATPIGVEHLLGKLQYKTI